MTGLIEVFFFFRSSIIVAPPMGNATKPFDMPCLAMMGLGP